MTTHANDNPERSSSMDDGDAPLTSALLERELQAVLGALLGMLEVMATDVQQPLKDRHRAWLSEALRYGHLLKDRLDALVLLCVPGQGERLKLAPCLLRRLVEHAVRGAAWEAQERGVLLALPGSEVYGAAHVLADALLVDAMLHGITETLLSALDTGAALDVHVSFASGLARVELLGRKGPLPPRAAQASELSMRAFRKLVELHSGELSVDLAALRACLALPLVEAL